MLPRYRYPVVLLVGARTGQGAFLWIHWAFQAFETAQRSAGGEEMSRLSDREELRVVGQEDIRGASGS